jgi:hypothetical protein
MKVAVIIGQALSILATSRSKPSRYDMRSRSHHSMNSLADRTLTRAVNE